jgi:hypothetical protein
MRITVGAAAMGLALTSSLVPRVAHAGEPTLKYVAPEPCPSGDTLRAELRGLLEASGSAGDLFAFEITITPEGAGFRGTVRATAPNPEAEGREVVDASCSAVVHALAFIAAVVVDPTVAERVDEQSSSAAGVHEGVPPPPVAAAPRSRPEPPPTTKPKRSAPPALPERSIRAGVLGAPSLETSLGPEVALEARLGIFGASAPAWRGLGWLAGLSVVHGGSSGIKTSAGSADLSWTHGRADGCLSVPSAKRVLFYPCVFLDAGVLTGTSQASPIKSRRALWLAPGLLGRASVEFSSDFELFVEVGGFAPLVRPRFLYVSPAGAAVVHAVPPLGMAAGAGLAIRVL